MTRCDRFEREGLLLLERGVQLDPHFDSCPDCLEARRVHARLGQHIAGLDADVEPSSAWKAGVWARIEHHRDAVAVGREPSLAGEHTAAALRNSVPIPVPTPASWRWTRYLAPAGAIAALLVVLVWLGPFATRAPGTVSLTTEVFAGPTIVRGQDAHPGDELHVRATMAEYSRAELRLYFNDTELIASCSEGSCVRQGGTISLATVLKSLGMYRPVLIVSNQAIPAAVGTLDQDAGAALRAGAVVKAGDPIPVR
jgi:hypothetical protein